MGAFRQKRVSCRIQYGEVTKLAEGTPLERVQVVNSGARVQIPPSPLVCIMYLQHRCEENTDRILVNYL